MLSVMQMREKSKWAMDKKRITGIRKWRSGEMEMREIVTAEVKGGKRRDSFNGQVVGVNFKVL